MSFQTDKVFSLLLRLLIFLSPLSLIADVTICNEMYLKGRPWTNGEFL